MHQVCSNYSATYQTENVEQVPIQRMLFYQCFQTGKCPLGKNKMVWEHTGKICSIKQTYSGDKLKLQGTDN